MFPIGTRFEDMNHKYEIIAHYHVFGDPRIKYRATHRITGETHEWGLSPELAADIFCEENYSCEIG